MNATVRIGGLREAALTLRLAPAEVQSQFRSVLAGAADVVRDHARAIAPRRTGALAASLASRVRTQGASVGAKVIARGLYAGVRMFGRKAAHPGHGHVRPHIRRLTPDPFLIRAQERQAGRVQQLVLDGVERALGEVFRGG